MLHNYTKYKQNSIEIEKVERVSQIFQNISKKKKKRKIEKNEEYIANTWFNFNGKTVPVYNKIKFK